MKEIKVNWDGFEVLELSYDMEDNGMSGKYNGWHWYTAKDMYTGEEVLQVYVK